MEIVMSYYTDQLFRGKKESKKSETTKIHLN